MLNWHRVLLIESRRRLLGIAGLVSLAFLFSSSRLNLGGAGLAPASSLVFLMAAVGIFAPRDVDEPGLWMLSLLFAMFPVAMLAFMITGTTKDWLYGSSIFGNSVIEKLDFLLTMTVQALTAWYLFAVTVDNFRLTRSARKSHEAKVSGLGGHTE